MNPQNITYDNFDRIEDYLFGRMTADEKTSFEVEITQNASLADEVAQQKLEHRSMELAIQAQLRSQFAAWDAEDVQEIEQSGGKVIEMTQPTASISKNTEGGGKTIVRRFSIFQFAAAAAMLIAVAVIGLQILKSPSSTPFDDSFVETTATVRGNSSSLPRDLSDIEALIKKQDFQNAISALDNLSDETKTQFPDKIQLLKGESLFKLKRFDEAISIFHQIELNGVSMANKEQAAWLLTLSYGASGKHKTEFEAYLAKILDNPNHSFITQARNLKNKI